MSSSHVPGNSTEERGEKLDLGGPAGLTSRGAGDDHVTSPAVMVGPGLFVSTGDRIT